MTDYSLKDIRLEKDDVILAGDGVFALLKIVYESFVQENKQQHGDG